MGGGGGGSKDYTQEQYDWDMKKHDYDYARMEDKYQYTKDAWDVQVWNQEQKVDYQNESATQQWQDKEKMRIFDINNQIKAYNASVEAYETQLDYNNLAAEIASADNTRQYNDRLTAIGFQNEELLMEHGFNDEALGMKLGFSKRKLTNQISGDKAAAAFKAEELKLKSMDAKGKIANMGQSGRTARKNMHAVVSAYANQQAELIDSITRKEQDYALGMEEATVTTGFERRKAESNKALSQRQLRESMKSAGSQYEADSSKIALDKYSAEIQAEAPKYEFEVKEAEYQQLVLDGEAEKATALRTEIRNAEREQTMFEVQQKMGQTVQQSQEAIQLQTTAQLIQEQYPILDENSQDYNKEMADEVIDLRDAFIVQGYQASDALTKATKYVMAGNTPEPAQEAAPSKSNGAVVQKKKKATVKKKIEASQSQPPDLQGQGNAERGEGTLDVNALSEDEFNALPEETLRRLRGDFG